MSGIFNQISHNSTAREVAHQLEALILEGILQAGEQLPGERDLATRFGVSRPILRQAIEELEEKQILTRRHGGGTFVGDVIGTVFSPQIASLLPEHPRATRDYLEYRREIEAVAAGLAAARSTGPDREQLKGIMKRMEKAHDAPDFELETSLDIEFHSAIGEMAHNLVLLHTLRSCYAMLAGGIFQNRSLLYSNDVARQAMFEQHMAIGNAVSQGDVEEAKKAATDHMIFVASETEKQQALHQREQISRLRLLNRHDKIKSKQGNAV